MRRRVTEVDANGAVLSLQLRSIDPRPFSEVEMKMITQPYQEGRISCDIYALTMAYSILNSAPGSREFEFEFVDGVSPVQLRVMRLRLLWTTLPRSTHGEMT